MYITPQAGKAQRLTVTGLTCITSINSNIIGVLCSQSATATGAVQLYHGVTASYSICGPIVFASGSVAQYISIPAWASGGITISIPAAQNPDVTLFWNPAGGNQ